MPTIEPKLAGGFRDYLPEDMIPRNIMLETIKQIFERFGFLPMDTPGMERAEVLAKDNTDFLIYRAGLEGAQDMAMRYDLTVPLARVVAANPDLPRPFKRYQFGRVWRGEKQQTSKGRWREFTQLDVDIVGSASPMADAEIVALMYQTLTTLGLTEYVIKVNNRQILKDIPAHVLREIDKLGKVGWDELSPLAQSYQATFSKKQTNNELEQLLANAKALGVPIEKIIVDNTVIRGLEYYTGNIFEAVLTAPDLQQYGSVFSGGRYDNLVERFAPFSIPAVGASIGVDRLFSALDQLGLLPREKTTAKVLVLNFNEDCQETVQILATNLRGSEIPTELYLGQEDTLKGQLAYAVKREYPIVIIVGPEEKARGVVKIKNMNSREQREVAIADVVSAVRETFQ